MKKNLVWLHSHFLYWMGGTKFIYEVNKQIATRLKNRYHLIVIAENASELAEQQYQQIGVKLISLHSHTSTNPWYWLVLPRFLHRRQQQIQSILAEQGFSKANTTIISSMFPMNVVASRIGWRHVQLCYEPFAFFYDPEFIAAFSTTKQLFIKVIRRLYGHLDRQATRAAHQVVTLNQVTQASIKEVYGVQSALVYAGVDLERFKPYVAEALRKKHRDQLVVIHSTDYSPVKGTDRVIKAMAQVVQQVPAAQLLITSTINNPGAEAKLNQLAAELGIANHVSFLGFVSLAELPQYYSLAKVLVQGSNSAKSGTTSMALPVKEAMACGTPAIRPDVGGEDVVNGVSGFLVDPADTAKLAAAIITILNNPILQASMGEAARSAIVGTYTWENTTDRILKYA